MKWGQLLALAFIVYLGFLFSNKKDQGGDY